ncbi:histidine kinase [uncultured Kocuria sp.]|uniref:sensor histidine kinase n=1 Tax=uncultured Kocuria sp. TaxID=259305 RepID=UPI0026185B92|nr:histidine kinase [uncultured Kocuria sp.]
MTPHRSQRAAEPVVGAAGAAPTTGPPRRRRSSAVDAVREAFRVHPWWTDGALALLYLVATVGSYLVERALDAPPPVVQLLQSLVFTVLVLFRRRLAVVGVVLVAVTVPVVRWFQTGWERNGIDPDLISPTGPGGDQVITVAAYDLGTLAVLLYAAAVHRPVRSAWAAHVVATVAVLGSILVYTDRWAWTVEIIAATAVLLAATALGLQIRVRRERLAELEERAHRLALERDQREQLAVAAERTRIAREMHDVLAHSLSVMVALADGATAALDRNPDGARRALQELSGTGRTALADTRRLLGVLRAEDTRGGPGEAQDPGGALLAPQPGADQLTALVGRFRAAGLPVRLTESGPPLPGDPALQLAVHRIVQECLTNILRHDPRSPRIDVRLRRAAGKIVLEVDNDRGRASAPSSGSGRGLIGVRERAAVFNGSVEAGPTSGGWRVRVVLRWEEA